jgi:hypothetical protein
VTKYRSSSGQEYDLDESPKTFEEVVEGFRQLEARLGDRLKVTHWPKHKGDFLAIQSAVIPGAVHNIFRFELDDVGRIASVRSAGTRDHLEVFEG